MAKPVVKKGPKANNKFHVTDKTTTFPVAKTDLLLYFLEDGTVGKTWKLDNDISFTLTKENYREVRGLVRNSLYYTDNCFIYHADLIRLN